MPMRVTLDKINCSNDFRYFQSDIEIERGRAAEKGKGITILWKIASLKWKNVPLNGVVRQLRISGIPPFFHFLINSYNSLIFSAFDSQLNSFLEYS